MSHILIHYREHCLNHRAVVVINNCDNIYIKHTDITVLFSVADTNNLGNIKIEVHLY